MAVSDSNSGSAEKQPIEPERLESRDVIELLDVMATLASHRNDSRHWRFELLTQLSRLLPASAAAAFILSVDAVLNVARVNSIFDAGFKVPAQQQAFQDEFNDAPFQDHLSRRAIAALFAANADTFTAARRDLVNDAEWYASSTVAQYRRAANVDDCLISVQRARIVAGDGADGTRLMVLCAFRPWEHALPFSPRDRALLDTLHRGLAWMYRTEAMLERLTRATALAPRLRQTLDYLLAGDTERQVAARMQISIHTVHDYVKALYQYFGVSSRGELMARWIQSGEPLPEVRKPGE